MFNKQPGTNCANKKEEKFLKGSFCLEKKLILNEDPDHLYCFYTVYFPVYSVKVTCLNLQGLRILLSSFSLVFSLNFYDLGTGSRVGGQENNFVLN